MGSEDGETHITLNFMVIWVSPSFFFSLSAFTAAVLIVAHILNYFESCALDTVVPSFTHDSFTLWIGVKWGPKGRVTLRISLIC